MSFVSRLNLFPEIMQITSPSLTPSSSSLLPNILETSPSPKELPIPGLLEGVLDEDLEIAELNKEQAESGQGSQSADPSFPSLRTREGEIFARTPLNLRPLKSRGLKEKRPQSVASSSISRCESSVNLGDPSPISKFEEDDSSGWFGTLSRTNRRLGGILKSLTPKPGETKTLASASADAAFDEDFSGTASSILNKPLSRSKTSLGSLLDLEGKSTSTTPSNISNRSSVTPLSFTSGDQYSRTATVTPKTLPKMSSLNESQRSSLPLNPYRVLSLPKSDRIDEEPLEKKIEESTLLRETSSDDLSQDEIDPPIQKFKPTPIKAKDQSILTPEAVKPERLEINSLPRGSVPLIPFPDNFPGAALNDLGSFPKDPEPPSRRSSVGIVPTPPRPGFVDESVKFKASPGGFKKVTPSRDSHSAEVGSSSRLKKDGKELDTDPKSIRFPRGIFSEDIVKQETKEEDWFFQKEGSLIEDPSKAFPIVSRVSPREESSKFMRPSVCGIAADVMQSDTFNLGLGTASYVTGFLPQVAASFTGASCSVLGDAIGFAQACKEGSKSEIAISGTQLAGDTESLIAGSMAAAGVSVAAGALLAGPIATTVAAGALTIYQGIETRNEFQFHAKFVEALKKENGFLEFLREYLETSSEKKELFEKRTSEMIRKKALILLENPKSFDQQGLASFAEEIEHQSFENCIRSSINTCMTGANALGAALAVPTHGISLAVTGGATLVYIIANKDDYLTNKIVDYYWNRSEIGRSKGIIFKHISVEYEKDGTPRLGDAEDWDSNTVFMFVSKNQLLLELKEKRSPHSPLIRANGQRDLLSVNQISMV